MKPKFSKELKKFVITKHVFHKLMMMNLLYLYSLIYVKAR